MNTFLSAKSRNRIFLSHFLTFFLLCIAILSFFGCQKKLDYFDYVSEARKNIFLAKTENLSLRVYASVKESPYATDGIPRERFPRLDAYLLTPEGNKTAYFYFTLNKENYGGEMSYDNVRGEYYYSVSMDIPDGITALPCKIIYGETEYAITASSVITENTLSPRKALDSLQKQQGDVFNTLTDKYGFAGEIHLRLLYESAPYYYFGVIDRQGKCIAFLMNAETGKVLAKRET